MITGVQSVPGVIANADDFVLNNQETDRGTISAVADQRTLFELYYRGYKGAIDAGVGSFMCSYNKINGTYACENNATLGDLKNPRGLNFSGWVLSDWGGVHSTVPSALAGLDVEMPGASYFGAALAAAVAAGEVPLPLIDDKVLRILTPMFSAGLFDIPPQGRADSNVSSARHAALARTLAASGTVLLQNTPGVLPLSNPASILVVGDAAHNQPYCCGDGSGGLIPPYVVDPLAGITARAGPGVNVSYQPGLPFFQNITTWFSPSRGDHFLDFACDECYGLYAAVRVEGFASAAPCPALGCVQLGLWYNDASSSNLVILDGMAPPAPGYAYVRPLGYALPLNYSGPAKTAPLELWRGMDTPTGQPPNSHLDFWTLSAGASRAEASAKGYTRVAALALLPLEPAVLPPPPAPTAEAVVVVVATGSGEGRDRASLSLSDRDNALVANLVAALPGRVVVVVNGPGAVLMPWAPLAGAIVMQWYPGQEMGNALADVLWGDVNPSGRLPLTFPAREADGPLQSPQQYPGVNGTVEYTERLLIGYRYWDAAGLAPLFPFGHGLSYTSFAYTNLTVDAAGADVRVAFAVQNTGAAVGKEVAQLYLAFPAAAGEPPLVLRDFAALPLAPGETTNVEFVLDQRAYSVWDEAAYAWKTVAGGEYGVAVGASSRDIRLKGAFVPAAEAPRQL